MTHRDETIGFGASPELGSHVFCVHIPAGRGGEVVVVERFGYNHQDRNRSLHEEVRVELERRVWSGIADTARRVFNARLKAEKIRVGRWSAGYNYVERVLGKELCVLAWAAETATGDEIPIIANKWAALRAEERWWLYAMTVSEAGGPADTERGWRRALYYALSDGKPPRKSKRVERVDAGVQSEEPSLTLSLFEE